MNKSDEDPGNLVTKILNDKFSSLLVENGYEICTLPIIETEISTRITRLLRSGIPLTAIVALHYVPEFNSLDYIKSIGIPYMFLNSGQTNASNCIIMDDEGGSIQAVKFLKATGKKNILYVSSNHSLHASMKIRKKVILKECANSGINVSDVVSLQELTPEYLKDQLENGVDTIVSASSSYAREVIFMLFQTGVRIPEEIGVLALDAYSHAWDIKGIELTHIKLPLERMAEIAAMELFKMIKTGEFKFDNILLPEYLLVGNSCMK